MPEVHRGQVRHCLFTAFLLPCHMSFTVLPPPFSFGLTGGGGGSGGGHEEVEG